MGTCMQPEGADLGEEAGEEQQYLTFLSGTDTFGVPILSVKEIIEYVTVTAVPMMPDCIQGVMNLRGQVVPVVDLPVRFDRPPTVPARKTCIVIVQVEADGGHRDMGIIVDAASQVLEIPSGDIEPPPLFGAALRGEFIQGIGKIDGRFVIILNMAHVLSIRELVQLKRSGDGTEPAAATSLRLSAKQAA